MKKLLAGAAIALTTLAGIAQADGHANYPDRPIMLMVSYGSGVLLLYFFRTIFSPL